MNAAAVSTVLKLQVNLVKLAWPTVLGGCSPTTVYRSLHPIGGGGGGGGAAAAVLERAAPRGEKRFTSVKNGCEVFACKFNCCGLAIHSLSPPQHNTMPSFWSDACNHALNRPLQEHLDSIHGSCSVTVRYSLPCATADLCCDNSVSFFVCCG
jgi:hypothetical protein